MSTLGDLLAEHTMLPGNAVDHLHAVVGEWQLLADLSFADYLMWVRRDDDVLVCVAQCRPNTAPTVMQTDAVGSVVTADRLPLVADAFTTAAAGVLVREYDGGARRFAGAARLSTLRRRRCDMASKWWRCLPSSRRNLAVERNSGHLETAYRACATDLLQMLAEGTFPDVRDVAMSRSTPRAGDGFLRLESTAS